MSWYSAFKGCFIPFAGPELKTPLSGALWIGKYLKPNILCGLCYMLIFSLDVVQTKFVSDGVASCRKSSGDPSMKHWGWK